MRTYKKALRTVISSNSLVAAGFSCRLSFPRARVGEGAYEAHRGRSAGSERGYVLWTGHRNYFGRAERMGWRRGWPDGLAAYGGATPEQLRRNGARARWMI